MPTFCNSPVLDPHLRIFQPKDLPCAPLKQLKYDFLLALIHIPDPHYHLRRYVPITIETPGSY